jgi:hypothetical protein
MRLQRSPIPASILKVGGEVGQDGTKRSLFIAQAVQERLSILEQALVVDEAAEAWRDEAYPELNDDENINGWLNWRS